MKFHSTNKLYFINKSICFLEIMVKITQKRVNLIVKHNQTVKPNLIIKLNIITNLNIPTTPTFLILLKMFLTTFKPLNQTFIHVHLN